MRDLKDFGLTSGIILVINVVFILVAAAMSWAIGYVALLGPLVRGFVFLWMALMALTILLMLVTRVNKRFNLYDHVNLYVAAHLLASALPLMIFVAYVAGHTQHIASSAAWGWGAWLAIVITGFLASYVGHAVVTVFFNGQLYALINLPVALLGYVLCLLWWQ